MQLVNFKEEDNLPSVLQSGRASRTMLIEYFAMNKANTSARKWLYSEFPEHYVWNVQDRYWKPHQRSGTIGRIVSANLSEGEQYFLRILLTHIRGATSFINLRTVDGKICSSFREAAEKQCLLEKDNATEECLTEASVFQMLFALRHLFATLLVFCEPNSPRSLWEKFYDAPSEDYRQNLQLTVEKVQDIMLDHITSFIKSMGKKITDYNLLAYNKASIIRNKPTKEIEAKLQISISEEDIHMKLLLNNAQRVAFDLIMHHIKKHLGGVFFIDGPGGVGKTFLYRALLATICSEGSIASTRIAVANLPGSRTAHSRFKIPLDINSSTGCNVGKQSAVATLIRKAKLIIWDEMPIAKKQNIEAFEVVLCDVCSNETIFAGKVVVLGGDFRQVLPVSPRSTCEECINNSLVESTLWPHLHILRLTENMRALHDPQFFDFLLDVGNGTYNDIDEDLITIPECMTISTKEGSNPILTFVEHIYPDFTENAFKSKYLTSRAILTPKNEFMDEINEVLINKFPGSTYPYTSFDKATNDKQENYPQEFLRSLIPNGIPPHQL